MAKKTPPRKKRLVQQAVVDTENAGVTSTELANCEDIVETVVNYNAFGYGETTPSYSQAELVDIKTSADESINFNDGRNGSGKPINLKQSTVAVEPLNVGSKGIHYLFPGVSGSAYTSVEQIAGTSVVPLTASSGSVQSLPIYAYSQDGPQASYIPSIMAQSGAFNTLFVPTTLTSTMPAPYTSSFRVEIAGAVSPGEGVGLYYQTNLNGPSAWYKVGDVFAGSSEFTYSGSHGSWKTTGLQNYSHSGPINIPTSSLSDPGGFVIVHSASWNTNTETGNSCPNHKTAYAGIVVSVYPV